MRTARRSAFRSFHGGRPSEFDLPDSGLWQVSPLVSDWRIARNMAEPVAHQAKLRGCDAAHRASNSDTHLTHACMPVFRQFSRVRQGRAEFADGRICAIAPIFGGALRILASHSMMPVNHTVRLPIALDKLLRKIAKNACSTGRCSPPAQPTPMHEAPRVTRARRPPATNLVTAGFQSQAIRQSRKTGIIDAGRHLTTPARDPSHNQSPGSGRVRDPVTGQNQTISQAPACGSQEWIPSADRAQGCEPCRP